MIFSSQIASNSNFILSAENHPVKVKHALEGTIIDCKKMKDNSYRFKIHWNDKTLPDAWKSEKFFKEKGLQKEMEKYLKEHPQPTPPSAKVSGSSTRASALCSKSHTSTPASPLINPKNDAEKKRR